MVTLYSPLDFKPVSVEISNYYNFEEYSILFNSLVPKNSLIFDVGANVGNKTHFYIQHDNKVICFEPIPDLVIGLRERFKNCSNVIIENIGLSNLDSIQIINKCDTNPNLSSFSDKYVKNNRFSERGYKWNSKIPVQTKTLDQMIEKYGLPYYCKIDVEGYEYQVLQGLTQKIPVISFECNIDQFKSTKKCLNYLSDLGYTKFNFAFTERGYYCFDHWQNNKELQTNIKAIIKRYNFSDIWGLWGDIYAIK